MTKKVASIGSEQFATIAVNLLHRGLIEAGRTTAKRVFRELDEGRTVTLTKLKMEDGGVVRMDLTLDATAFDGDLNFSMFRDGVLSLISQLSEPLRAGKPVAVLHPIDEAGNPENDTNRVFAAGGITVSEGKANVLMLGVRPDAQQPIVTLQLLYVDAAQFQSDSVASTS